MHSFTFLGFTFTKGPSRQDMEVKYYHLFQMHDVNGSLSLDIEEIQKMMEKCNVMFWLSRGQSAEPTLMHLGYRCSGCGDGSAEAPPFRGIRYRCVQCPQVPGLDLCKMCWEMGVMPAPMRVRDPSTQTTKKVQHQVTHIFDAHFPEDWDPQASIKTEIDRMMMWDDDNSKSIDLEEFYKWAHHDKRIKAMLNAVTLLVKELVNVDRIIVSENATDDQHMFCKADVYDFTFSP